MTVSTAARSLARRALAGATSLSVLLAVSLLAASASAQVFSEFQSNPPGADPGTQTFEISGTPGTPFSGAIVSVENDGADGRVDRASQVSGTFNADGLLVVSVPDLENPSFTVILTDSFTGSVGDDIDVDDDGTVDDLSAFGTILDAIGVPDEIGDVASLYGADVGGTDFAFTGAEPELIFRSGSTGDLYAVNELGDEVAYDTAGNEVLASDFSSDPTTEPTFGNINPFRIQPSEECTTSSPLYISAFSAGDPGQVTVTNSDAASGDTVELSGCTLAVYDGFDELVEDTETAPDPTPLAPQSSYVYAPAIEAGRPGAVVLSTADLEVDDRVSDAVTTEGTTVVTGVVFDATGAVYVSGGARGECGNGGGQRSCSSAEGAANFVNALGAVFGGATGAEEPGALSLGVAVGPNPVRSASRVTYGVGQPADVRVSVFDALGREVAVLAQGPRGAGVHAATLDGSALTAGVYIVRAVVGAEARTATVTVVR